MKSDHLVTPLLKYDLKQACVPLAASMEQNAHAHLHLD
jgi:hypothetical protein